MIPVASLLVPTQHPQHPQHIVIHGRQYYSWRGWIYPYPSAAEGALEGNRLDCLCWMIHKFALSNRRFVSHLSVPPGELRILDVGFGTGEWAYRTAVDLPKAIIVGIDIHGFQRENYRHLFPNVDLRCPVDFNDEDWGLPDETFNLVRLSLLCGTVSDWEGLYRRARRYLKPGAGHIELIEIDWQPRCYEGHVFPPHAQPIMNWYEDIVTATTHLGMPISYREDTGDLLRRAGFLSVSQTTIQIPFYEGRNDPYEKQLASWLRTSMGDAELQSYQSLSLYPLTQVLSYSPGRVQAMCERARKVLNTSRIPLYYNLHIWTARKGCS